MQEQIEKLEAEIQLIQARNKKVEADKAWETSWARIALITILTYFTVLLVLHFLKFENIFLSALIPAVGYFLSTQTIPLIKRWWIRKVWKK